MTSKSKSLRAQDAPWYRYWQALYLAFYSRRFYVDVYKRWKGLGILYLLFLIAILCIPYSLHLIQQFNHHFDEEIIEPLKQLPLLNIQRGSIQFDKPMPYFIRSKHGDVVAIVDTTGSIKNINKDYPYLVFLIKKHELQYRTPPFHLYLNLPGMTPDEKIYTEKFSPVANEVFDAKAWIKQAKLNRLKYFGDFLIYPFLVATFFGAFLGPFIFMALLGQLLALAVFKFRLRLKETFRIFMVASTPQMLFFFLCLITGITFAYASLVNILILVGFFCYGVLMIRKEGKQLVHA